MEADSRGRRIGGFAKSADRRQAGNSGDKFPTYKDNRLRPDAPYFRSSSSPCSEGIDLMGSIKVSRATTEA